MNSKHFLQVSGLATLFVISSFAFKSNNSVTPVSAYEDISLNNSTDAFKLLDKEFSKDDNFVYTADLHFRSGQAGGLAFGSQENDHYYVLNMDRVENRVKLLYFAAKEEGGYTPTELKVDYFIGNDKMTQSEAAFVSPRVANIENVNLKVILTKENEHAYAEFYVEGIKRFGIDTVIDLNDLGTSFTYEGGFLGINCFNADVYLTNIEIGKSDYSYFSEPYRNQYHLQPFSKWTNDPNALCYYNGYYHVFYQMHPFGLLWGDMFWGHARSKDLIHFEFLPICLFPEEGGTEFGPNTGWMWSGCAIAYEHGMSNDIDSKNWFPNGAGNGMLAIFTRDGGRQDQVVISSDDEGLTWTKRHRIPQDLTGHTGEKIDWRDPKVFPLKKDASDKVTVWGMTLSSYGLNKGWFLKSENLLDWSIAGSFPLPTPECIGVGVLKDQDNVEHAYLTNKSRTYILGALNYNEMTGQVTFIDENNVDISTYTVDNIPLKPLDFGPDSYASQSFYINDVHSDYYGKDIVLNWFSGDLNASFCTGPGEYAGLRKRWNGGFTIPVEYGVYKSGSEYRISQKPITVNNPHLEKTNILDLENKSLASNSINPLKDVHTHIFELDASIKTNNEGAITFKVDVGDDEYMQFGWNKVDGYYVDRTNLDDKGIGTNIDWHTKYASHIMGDSDVKTFYVLSDNGGLEVFCENFSISFYFVTTASIYSTGASLKADSAVINKLELNEVHSAYKKKNVLPEEGVLYVSSNEVELDEKFVNSKYVTCSFSGNVDLVWELIEGEDVVNCSFSNQGVLITAKGVGTAQIKVKAGEHEQLINVNVYASSFTSDLTFNKDNIVSGSWVMADSYIIGEKLSGNAFLLANESGTDFTFTGQFDIVSGTAASLVFRASSDMSSYLVANYDTNERVVKLWSTHGELARSGVINVNNDNIVLSVKAVEKDIQIIINGTVAISYKLKDNEPLSGYFGLNVFSGKAQFKSLSLAKENYAYTSGELVVNLGVDQFVSAVYNVTLGNTLVNSDFYYQMAGNLYIKDSYFDLLKEDGNYEFRIVGSAYSFNIKVDVKLTHVFIIDDMTIEKGNNAVIYVGNNAINKVQVNGEVLAADAYSLKDYSLTIYKESFKEGENEVVINDSISFTITVTDTDNVISSTNKTTTIDYRPIVFSSVGGGSALLAGVGVLLFFLIRKKKLSKVVK